MEYKYDDRNVPFVVHVVLSHPDIANIQIKNNPFRDGGKTRVFCYYGLKLVNNNKYITVGYPSKRILYQYSEESYKDALVASFVLHLN